MRALLVEDDPSVSQFVSGGLRAAAFAVDVAADGVDGSHLARTEPYDVIVLDLMLPGKDGFAVLRELRSAQVTTPVICLTARDNVDDKVKGLDLGADDYLAKPFSFAEFLARVRALLRRGAALTQNPIVVADLSVDMVTRIVTRGGRRIDLAPNEFALLAYLARNAGSVLSRAMILEHVWNMNQDPLTNVIDVHINRLRRKIDSGFAVPLIRTVRGVGYVLREPDIAA